MPKRKPIEIAFVGLKPGTHTFNYTVDESFFDSASARDFSNCAATIQVTLDKKNGFMLLKFEIGGRADVVCDRCGNALTKDLWDEFNMVVKMVDNPDEMNEQEDDPDVFYISKTESHLYLDEWIYEFVSLSVPLQKVCSEEEMGGPQCNQEVLNMLKDMETRAADNAGSIWKDLDQFKATENENEQDT